LSFQTPQLENNKKIQANGFRLPQASPRFKKQGQDKLPRTSASLAFYHRLNTGKAFSFLFFLFLFSFEMYL